jgi:peroxiredoxin
VGLAEILGEVAYNDSKSLNDVLGESMGLVMVFVPDTTGVSSYLQLKNLRNNINQITTLGWSVVIITSQNKGGISDLPFPVITDSENTFATYFNTLGTDFSNPHISMRTKRRTYLIQNDYQTAHVIDDIHPGDHVGDILNLIQPDTDYSFESSTSKV